MKKFTLLLLLLANTVAQAQVLRKIATAVKCVPKAALVAKAGEAALCQQQILQQHQNMLTASHEQTLNSFQKINHKQQHQQQILERHLIQKQCGLEKVSKNQRFHPVSSYKECHKFFLNEQEKLFSTSPNRKIVFKQVLK